MYRALTPQWAGTLLGLVQVAMIPIPFVFYKWGAKIRSKSPLIRQMREDQEKSERRAEKARKAEERRVMRERGHAMRADELEFGDPEKGDDPEKDCVVRDPRPVVIDQE